MFLTDENNFMACFHMKNDYYLKLLMIFVLEQLCFQSLQYLSSIHYL